MAIAALWLTLIVAFSEAPSLTMRQFKQLRSEAKTASEFRQVAAFADEQAIDNWRKAAECQEELDGYRSGKVPYPVIPKHPDRVQTLQSLILTYNRAAERWAHIRRHFVAKAGAADSPARHRRN